MDVHECLRESQPALRVVVVVSRLLGSDGGVVLGLIVLVLDGQRLREGRRDAAKRGVPTEPFQDRVAGAQLSLRDPGSRRPHLDEVRRVGADHRGIARQPQLLECTTRFGHHATRTVEVPSHGDEGGQKCSNGGRGPQVAAGLLEQSLTSRQRLA